MPNLSPEKIASFQTKILTWYSEHQRDLPWRKTRDPYHILVSEIMLQQTQVNRVIAKFEAWLKAFPTVTDLAKAPTSEVLKLWSGLGYNRRALHLKRTAIVVSEKYNGRFPPDEKALLDLPGIGQYTARAVLCFAFDKQVAVVDTNVKKIILTRILNQELRLEDSSSSTQSVQLTDKQFTEIAEQLLPKGKAYAWNQALMDYASAVLKKEKIPIPKQSKFHGSRRFYRGQILKLLLAKKQIPVAGLGKLIKTDYTEEEHAWLQKLLEELEKEGFIAMKNDSIELTAN